MTKPAYDCPKCAGNGEIAAFRNVLGGVCFTCGGAGKTTRKPAKPSKLWACIYNGKRILNTRAKTEPQALRKAIAHFHAHREKPAFQGITTDQISVVPTI